MMTGGSWRCSFPGWVPSGRECTVAPREVSSETRNSDIWGGLSVGWEGRKGGKEGTYFDDIGTAVIVCGDGGNGNGFAEALVVD